MSKKDKENFRIGVPSIGIPRIGFPNIGLPNFNIFGNIKKIITYVIIFIIVMFLLKLFF